MTITFSALTLLVGRQEGHPACKKTEQWGVGVVDCLEQVQTCIWPSGFHCHSLSLASVKSRLVLPFWYRLTWVVPDKGPLNGCMLNGCNCQEISNCCGPVLTYWLTDCRRQWLTDCLSCTAFCRDSFSLLRQLCTVGHGIFYMADVNNFLLVN